MSQRVITKKPEKSRVRGNKNYKLDYRYVKKKKKADLETKENYNFLVCGVYKRTFRISRCNVVVGTSLRLNRKELSLSCIRRIQRVKDGVTNAEA